MHLARLAPAEKAQPADPLRSADGRRPFSEYVAALVPEGDEPPASLFHEVWGSLRAALRSELKKRGLWDSPPGFLGVYGWETWEAAALEELLADAYVFVFVDRLRSLRAQLQVKPNVDGLVFLNLRHFLHERQRAHDPLGFRVFEVLRSAVRQAVATQTLQVIEGETEVRNETLLRFPGTEPETRPPEELVRVVDGWCAALLPDLVTLRGQGQDEVVGRLCRRLPDLRLHGWGSFLFREVADAFKTAARQRWAAALIHEMPEIVPETPESVASRSVPPDSSLEERQSFQRLVGCVQASLDRLEAREKTKRYLSTLWQFFRIQAADPDDGRFSRLLDVESGEHRSQRRLAELLGIPRERLPELFGVLGRMLERCRQAPTWRSGKSPQEDR